MNQIRNVFFALVFVVGFVALTSVFTVAQTQRAIVLRLGRIVTDSADKPKLLGPGLHFKMPFVSNVLLFDTRLQTLDIRKTRVVTLKKKDVIVRSYVKWRIKDFARFYLATQSTQGSFARIEDILYNIVDDGLRAEFGKRTIPEVVSGERTDIMDIVQGKIAVSVESMGIDVVDVRIKNIDFPEKVSESVYQRMRTNREEVATGHRADGERQASIIRARADKDARVILAKAERQVKEIKAKADRKAAKIYNDAYNKNPEFYSFYQSMRTYQEAFNHKSDLLVLAPDTDFFKYFVNASGKTQS